MPIHAFWLILGLALLLGMVGRVAIARRREQRGLLALAARHGLNFSPDDLMGLHDRYHSLELIRTGHSRHTRNALYGMTPTGPLSLFEYRFELGFGLHRRARQWWIAVIETEMAQAPWSARPTPAGAARAESPRSVRMGSFQVEVEHEETIAKLHANGIDRLLESAPPQAHFEVRGQLAALAIPAEDGSADLEGLLKTALWLANKP